MPRVQGLTKVVWRFRLQRTQKASEELRRMSLRSLVYKMMATSPLVFLGAMAAQSRFDNDPFQGLSCTPQEQEAISAYIEPVKAANGLYQTSSSPKQVREVAQMWIKGSDGGQLKALLPSSSEDSMRSPVKSQIQRANDMIALRLLAISEKELVAKKYSDAALDAATALRVGQVIKYSDPLTVGTIGTAERSLLVKIQKITSKLNDVERSQLRNQIVAFKLHQQSLTALARVSELNHNREIQRTTVNERAIEDPEHATEAGMDFKPVPITAVLNEINVNKGRGAHPNANPYVLSLKLAYSSEAKVKIFTNRLLQNLKTPDDSVSL